MTEEAQKYLQRLNEKISQLQARKQTLIFRNKEQQRKARTRRLIQNGALAEKYLHCEDMQPQEFEKFLQILFSRKGAKEVFQYVKKSLP